MSKENSSPVTEKDPVEDILAVLKKNQKLLVLIGVAILLAFGVFAGLKEMKKSAEIKAQTALFDVEKEIEKTEKELAKTDLPDPKEKKAPVAKAPEVDFEKSFGPGIVKLKAIVSEHSDTKAAIRATMRLISLYSKYDKKDEALEAAKKINLNSSKDVLSVLFQFQKGSLLLDTSNFDDAISIFSQLSELKDFDYIHALSKLKKAVALEKKGEAEEAKSLYESVSSDYPEHEAGKTARQYLRIMESK